MLQSPELFNTRLLAVSLHYLRAIQAGKVIAAQDLWAARSAASSARGDGEVGVIPIMGLITQRSPWWGTSTEQTIASVRAAKADAGIKAVVLEVDSPGGEVYGMDEVAAEIRDLRKSKPVVGVANSLAASAAYNIISQADAIFVTPSGEIGSVGVYGMHVDYSVALDQEGIKVTFVTAGEGKVEGNPYEPLTEEAAASMQTDIDRYYGMFVANVRKGRSNSSGVTSEQIRDEWKAHVYGAAQAVQIGMADQVGTIDDAIRAARALGKAKSSKSAELTSTAIQRKRSRAG